MACAESSNPSSIPSPNQPAVKQPSETPSNRSDKTLPVTITINASTTVTGTGNTLQANTAANVEMAGCIADCISATLARTHEGQFPITSTPEASSIRSQSPITIHLDCGIKLTGMQNMVTNTALQPQRISCKLPAGSRGVVIRRTNLKRPSGGDLAVGPSQCCRPAQRVNNSVAAQALAEIAGNKRRAVDDAAGAGADVVASANGPAAGGAAAEDRTPQKRIKVEE